MRWCVLPSRAWGRTCLSCRSSHGRKNPNTIWTDAFRATLHTTMTEVANGLAPLVAIKRRAIDFDAAD